MYYKRLEEGTFVPPTSEGDQTVVRWPELVLTVEEIHIYPDGDLSDMTCIGALPERVIGKGIAGPGLLATILVDKYMDHLPLYHQCQRFAREEDLSPGERKDLRLEASLPIINMLGACTCMTVCWK